MPTTHELEGWYVNIEDPHTRGDHEVRTRDHVLDLWVEPDRTRSRKDEDELALAVRQGRYNRDEAELITSVAEQAEAVDRRVGDAVLRRLGDLRPRPGLAGPPAAARPQGAVIAQAAFGGKPPAGVVLHRT